MAGRIDLRQGSLSIGAVGMQCAAAREDSIFMAADTGDLWEVSYLRPFVAAHDPAEIEALRNDAWPEELKRADLSHPSAHVSAHVCKVRRQIRYNELACPEGTLQAYLPLDD